MKCSFHQRDRDELVDKMTGMKARVSELQHREQDAYEQVKRSVQMVEQAQLEQTQVTPVCWQKQARNYNFVPKDTNAQANLKFHGCGVFPKCK